MDSLAYRVANSAIGAAIARAVSAARAGQEARTYHCAKDARGFNVPAGQIGIYNDQITLHEHEEIVLDGELLSADDGSVGNLVELPAIIVLGLNSSGVLAPLESGDAIDIASIAAGDNNIGNVDVLSVIPGYGTTNLGKLFDTTATSADVGVAPMFVTRASPQANVAAGKYTFAAVDERETLYTRPAFLAGTAIVDADISADYTSAYHDCRGYNLVWFALQFADDSAGVLYFQGSLDGTNHPIDLTIAAGGVFLETGGVAWTGVTFAGPDAAITIADPGAGGSKILVGFSNPPPYIRYFFDRTGGSATGLDSQPALQAM